MQIYKLNLWNAEGGMRNAEKEKAECLKFTFSAFRIPNSPFIYLCHML
jgi:hypothetical protein